VSPLAPASRMILASSPIAAPPAQLLFYAA
jgi:hypothetical protein